MYTMNSNKGLPNYTYVEFRRFWTETKAWTIRLKYSFQTMLDQFLGNVTGNMSKEWYNLGGSNNNNAKIGRLICILYTVASVQVMQNCLFQGHIIFFFTDHWGTKKCSNDYTEWSQRERFHLRPNSWLVKRTFGR